MGKSFAKKLSGFDCEVLCYDLKDGVGDQHARQVTLEELQEKTDVLSLHTPQTPLTIGMVNASFIAAFKKPFYLINTARGKSVVTEDLVNALEEKKILGAGLDVLEYEKSSFENLFRNSEIPTAFKKLIQMPQVLLSPHVAGWSVESKYKLADVIAQKIIADFEPNHS
jgi:D-3-phosphoglycerate dehydrogenase